MTKMRLCRSISAKEIAGIIKVNVSTISRYENGRFTFEKADLNMLERYALSCNQDKYSLFTDYLLFRKCHKQILRAYIEKQGITKSELGKLFGVSKTLALTWFNKENRCPSFKVWEDKLKEFSVEWVKENNVDN